MNLVVKDSAGELHSFPDYSVCYQQGGMCRIYRKETGSNATLANFTNPIYVKWMSDEDLYTTRMNQMQMAAR